MGGGLGSISSTSQCTHTVPGIRAVTGARGLPSHSPAPHFPPWCSPKSGDRSISNAYGCGSVIQVRAAAAGAPSRRRAVPLAVAPLQLQLVTRLLPAPPLSSLHVAPAAASAILRSSSSTLPSPLLLLPSPPSPGLQYKFTTWALLAAYQACEHSNANYIKLLQVGGWVLRPPLALASCMHGAGGPEGAADQMVLPTHLAPNLL